MIYEIFDRNKIYDCSEVAHRLKLSESTIREKVFRRQIPFFKVGQGRNAAVRFYGQSLNEWLARINMFKILPGEKYKKPRKKPTGKGIIEFERMVETLKKKG